MTINILSKREDANIVLSYMEDGKRVKYDVMIRYSDKEESYFSTPFPINFTKPKPKTKIEITYRSSIGVLYAETKLIDCCLSMNEIMFTVKTPTYWEDRESRRSRRKECNIPVTVEYSGYKFESESYDIATGGISFIAPEDMPDTYKNLPATVSLKFAPDNVVTVTGKFIREKELGGDDSVKLFVYKFTHVSSLTRMTIKNYMINSK